MIDGFKRLRAMGDDDDDPAAATHVQDRLCQRLLALGVEIGGGLIEHDQERFAVEGTREPDTLPLPCRQRQPALADLRAVAVRKGEDEVVRAGGTRGLQDDGGGCLRVESRNVHRDAAVEQFNVLGKIANVLAEGVGRPVIERGIVQPDPASNARPHPHQRACQRRFAGSARSNDADRLPAPQLERDVTDGGPLRVWSANIEILDRESFNRRRQCQPLLLAGQELQQRIEPLSRLPRSNETFPVRNRHFDGRQGPRGQDRSGNDDAGRRFLVDDEDGANGKDQRLQDRPEDLGGAPEPARDIAGSLMGREILRVDVPPTQRRLLPHAHGLQNLGISSAFERQCRSRDCETRGRLCRSARPGFREDRNADEHQRAGQRGDADPEVEEKANAQIDRHPGQIEQRSRPAARQEAADLVEVPHRLQAVAIGPGLQRQANERVEYANAEPFIKVPADPHADPASDQIEPTLKQVKDRGQNHQGHQGRYAAPGQHPIIDLQHEERTGEHEQIAHSAEGRESPEYPAARPQECRHLRLRPLIILRRPQAISEYFLPEGFNQTPRPTGQPPRRQFRVAGPLPSGRP